MIKRVLLPLGLCVIALSLGACAQNIREYKEPGVKPCIIPTDMPNNAMSRLGIRTIHNYRTYRIIVPIDPVFEIRSAEIRDEAYPGLTMLSHQLRRFMPGCMTVK